MIRKSWSGQRPGQTTEKVTLPYFVGKRQKEVFLAQIEDYNANLLDYNASLLEKGVGIPDHAAIEYEVEKFRDGFYIWLHCHPIDLLLLGKRLSGT